MATRIYWVGLGGLSFWLPFVFVSLALRQDVNLWALNLVPLAGVELLGLAGRAGVRHQPRWGWVLAGIYLLGPASMLLPSLLIRSAGMQAVPGEGMWTVMFCLFPPATLWIATLNGAIFSVLAVTLVLPFLAASQARKGAGNERSAG